MSFCKNQKPEQTPGPICSNQLNQLKDKICIEVNKVFDACLKQVPLDNYEVQLVGFVPATYAKPLKYVSATTDRSELEDLEITPLKDTNGCSRVKGIVIIYLKVVLEDAKGNTVNAEGKIILPLDIVLFIPKGAVVDTNISAVINCIITKATINDDNILTINACIAVIIKVTAPVDILIPSFGYCYIPPCQDYTAENGCSMFDMPLFPKDRE